ncbi:hypothetical protein J1605_016974 [Eschrichtius robustus]|uniref:Uncharacterized protein n=1 Tax=Eschrichtius robustus TaxID=9764 RepID=A0AB34HZZ8_ESCRO|nr:hypothetical protein J1605_016974 [Eschrichtius robustus]
MHAVRVLDGHTACWGSGDRDGPWADLVQHGIRRQALRVKWSHLKLPWVDLDWLIDISCQITELDLSANCLASLPSIIPWGLINLRKLNLSDNLLGELPSVKSSDEIICSRWAPALQPLG